LCLRGDTIYSYQEKAFRPFYFRPSFVVRRILKRMKNNTIFADLKVFVKTIICEDKDHLFLGLK
jgi:hypothetical protein|tara:strand:+ start:514 stop:705 length:192 start_codon:yes stop_codon:yes gene_type:complete